MSSLISGSRSSAETMMLVRASSFAAGEEGPASTSQTLPLMSSQEASKIASSRPSLLPKYFINWDSLVPAARAMAEVLAFSYPRRANRVLAAFNRRRRGERVEAVSTVGIGAPASPTRRPGRLRGIKVIITRSEGKVQLPLQTWSCHLGKNGIHRLRRFGRLRERR